MNAVEHDLADVCQEWRRLAEAEGEAITARNWSLLAACQKALELLQTRTTPILAATRAEWAGSADRADREQKLNALLQELIQLEHRNRTLLDGMLATAHKKMDDLNRAGRHLKQIRRSYAFAPAAAWNSFS